MKISLLIQTFIGRVKLTDYHRHDKNIGRYRLLHHQASIAAHNTHLLISAGILRWSFLALQYDRPIDMAMESVYVYPLTALLTSVRVVFQRSVSHRNSQSVHTQGSTPVSAARTQLESSCMSSRDLASLAVPHGRFLTAVSELPTGVGVGNYAKQAA